MDRFGLKIFISPAGAAIALICFFLPWIKFDCGSGYNYFSGIELLDTSWPILIASVFIIGLFAILLAKRSLPLSKPILLGCSIAALIYLLYIYFRQSHYCATNDATKNFSFLPGFWGTIAGFCISVIGSLLLPGKTGRVPLDPLLNDPLRDEKL